MVKKRLQNSVLFPAGILIVLFALILSGTGCAESEDPEAQAFSEATELDAVRISYVDFMEGQPPPDYKEYTGAEYKPSFNPDPAVPPQCWAETGYGTQNACMTCHTDYLAEIGQGNSHSIAEDQIQYRFSSPGLNHMNWKNLVHPEAVADRLQSEGLSVPDPADPDNMDYVRHDNWREAYQEARANGDVTWNNISNKITDYRMIPALNPDHLYPVRNPDPTDGGTHGYIDENGFVRDNMEQLTGWRAVNFFPSQVYTPVNGSVSGIYIRLPREFMTSGGRMDAEVYRENFSLLEKNIKNLPVDKENYLGDARDRRIKSGFYPVGTEFIQTLHYVDLNADHEMGDAVDGAAGGSGLTYEFPGTRSKRLKEIRFMYKWREKGPETSPETAPSVTDQISSVIGEPWKGWISNREGWVMSGFIENREGRLRPQSAEEMIQCLGCHSRTGNTIDSVWSFPRKLPGEKGWGEMDYGKFDSENTGLSHLPDYLNALMQMGEREYFYFTAAGADLFGNLSGELKDDLKLYLKDHPDSPPSSILDDRELRESGKEFREKAMQKRQKIMRSYAEEGGYLMRNPENGRYFIKGSVMYPHPDTMRANIAMYRRIVLDQSYNLGKYVFGFLDIPVPLNFISDGTDRNAEGELIPAGEVIESRPYNENGIGTTPTGLTPLNEEGKPLDDQGRVVDIGRSPEKAAGHIQKGGAFETRYNPILGEKVRKLK